VGTRVAFTIGPVPSVLVLEWLAHMRGLVAAVRRRRFELTISVNDDLVGLIEALFDVWEVHAQTRETFQWSTETDTEQVEHVVAQWLALGSLSDADLEVLGTTWAPPHTRPVVDAIVAGAKQALSVADRGAELSRRLDENG
jgi:hypothetical protein